ncbi:ribose 5-phosphate isomerase B [Mycolicibacterium sp. BK556]|nr:ribose 5-phosphate isomerase B [Mycolicibacterium sp. BK556]MBB3636369.1 ribose 5-phosphate isomerase B [Mycolicibacterium sp. BK607]
MPAVDYAPFCIAAALEVVNGEADYGIVIGASAQGEQIAANKVKGVRAALVTDVHFAKLARRDNDANIIALPGRIIAKEYAVEILSVWIQTQFEGGRHARRLNDIKLFEEGLLDLKATKPRSGDREQ